MAYNPTFKERLDFAKSDIKSRVKTIERLHARAKLEPVGSAKRAAIYEQISHNHSVLKGMRSIYKYFGDYNG